MKKRLTLIPTILFTLTIFAQNEGNFWYFGCEAGIDFTDGTATVLTDGAMCTREGVASISHPESGELLFYTDGKNVWNQDHELMPEGFGLEGDASSTQSGIIVPHPDVYTQGPNNNIYYIFTNDFKEGFGGFRYSVVDMNEDGGLGDVIEKNNFLFSNNTERVAAIRACGDNKFWVCTTVYNSPDLNAYLVDENGVTEDPVVSELALTITDINDKIGYMRFNKKGDKLAIVYFSSAEVHVYDFDYDTGMVLEDPIILDDFPDRIYGVEFSPNNELLYISSLSAQNEGVIQFNITDPAPESTKTIIHGSDTYGYGALQLGPDGKIYVGREIQAGPNNYIAQPYLEVINQPDIEGPGCDYEDEGLYLEGAETFIGLPTIIEFDFNVSLNINQTLCQDDNSVYLNIAGGAEPINITWSNTTENTDSLNNLEEGLYSVSITDDEGCSFTADFEITATGIDFEIPTFQDILICQEGEGLVEIILAESLTPDASFSYEWSPIDGLDDPTLLNATATISESSIYTLTITDENGCQASDEVQISINELPAFNYQDVLIICEQDTALIYPDLAFEFVDDYDYLWQDGSIDPNYVITAENEGEDIWVEISNDTCVRRDSIQVQTYTCEIFLPIELVAFEGIALEEQNLIEWQALIEKELDYYQLESSIDGQNFTALSRVEKQGPATNILQYHYYDSNPAPKTYYRLLMKDISGATNYSNIILLERGQDITSFIQLYPIPAKESITLRLHTSMSEKYHLSVHNTTGQLVLEEELNTQAGWNQHNLSVAFISSGIYFVNLQSDKELLKIRFLKE